MPDDFFDAEDRDRIDAGTGQRRRGGRGVAGVASRIATHAALSNYAITQALPRIADLPASDSLFMESLISSIAQGDDAAKERVRAFLAKHADKVQKT